MAKIKVQTVVGMLFAVVLHNAAHGWEEIRPFDQGSSGSVAKSSVDAFDGACAKSFYTDEFVYRGTGAAELSIAEGQEGFGDWGGVVDFPSKIGDGDHLWLSFAIRIPTEFEIDTPSNGSLKFIRFKSEESNGSHNGYIDIQIVDDGDSGSSEFRMIREGPGPKWFYFGNNGLLTRDKWHRIDVFVQLDEVLASEGGMSRVSMWVDTVQVVDERSFRTLHEAGDVFTAFYLFTYWNGRAPKDQHLWIDEIRMSTEDPEWASELKGPGQKIKPIENLKVIVNEN